MKSVASINCPNCSKEVPLSVEDREITINGKPLVVPHFGYGCTDCLEVFTTTESDTFTLTLAQNSKGATHEANILERIKAELDKIENLNHYQISASTDSFQVWDKRKKDGLVIDADFKYGLLDNLIDALFSEGSLYEYLLKREERLSAQ